MAVCEKCIFLRRVRPRSQLLAAVVDTTDAAVASALGKIVEDEQKQRDAEAEFKRAQASTEQSMWPRQPVMSSYCAQQEGDGLYLIAEVKNLGGRCSDFVAGRPERKACSDCQHRIPGAGLERDRQREDLITRLHLEATSAQASTSGPEGMLKARREGVPALKGFELSGAYAADGRLPAKPEYLDYCAALSNDDEYAVCAIVNPHNTCSAWETASAATPDSGQAAPSQAIASTDVLGAPPPEPSNGSGPGQARPASPAAEANIPPLTAEIQSDVMEMLAWVFPVGTDAGPLSDGGALALEWSRDDGAGAWFWLRMLTGYHQAARSQDDVTRERVRNELRQQVLREVRNGQHPFWRLLILAKDTTTVESPARHDRPTADRAHQARRSSPGQDLPPATGSSEAFAWAPGRIAGLMRQIREGHEQKSTELEGSDAILAAQTRAQNELAYTKLMSKIAELDHQKQMAIIDNIK